MHEFTNILWYCIQMCHVMFMSVFDYMNQIINGNTFKFLAEEQSILWQPGRKWHNVHSWNRWQAFNFSLDTKLTNRTMSPFLWRRIQRILLAYLRQIYGKVREKVALVSLWNLGLKSKVKVRSVQLLKVGVGHTYNKLRFSCILTNYSLLSYFWISGLNFTNILRAAFVPTVLCQSSTNLKRKHKKAVCATYVRKSCT